MKKYLLTGAAGFIASVVAKMLLEQGAEVVGLDNLNHAYDVRLKEYRLANLGKLPGFSFYKLDVSDRSLLQNALLTGQDFDAVINLAARAGVRDSLEDPWVYMETNATGTLNLLELCRQENIPKFILASTSSIYGADAQVPTPETATSDKPLQAYAASKKAAEVMAHAFHYLYGISQYMDLLDDQIWSCSVLVNGFRRKCLFISMEMATNLVGLLMLMISRGEPSPH